MDFLGNNDLFFKDADPIDMAAARAAESYRTWGYKRPSEWLAQYIQEHPSIAETIDISYWSHSQTNSHARCALHRWMEKVLGLRGKSGKGAEFGTQRHTELENYMLDRLAEDRLHPAAKVLLRHIPPREAVRAKQVLIETEISGLTHFFPFPVKGKIDLLDLRLDIWKVRDYKFLAPSSMDRAPTPETIWLEMQLNLYAFWVWEGPLGYKGKYLDIGQWQVNKQNHQVYTPDALITKDQCVQRMVALRVIVEQIRKMNLIMDPAWVPINAPHGPGKSAACKMYGRNGEITCRGVALCQAAQEVSVAGLRESIASLPTGGPVVVIASLPDGTRLPDGAHKSPHNGGLYAVVGGIFTHYSMVEKPGGQVVQDPNIGWVVFDPARHPRFTEAALPSGHVGVNPPEGTPPPAPLLQPGQLQNAPALSEDESDEDEDSGAGVRLFIEEGIPKGAAQRLLNGGVTSIEKLKAMTLSQLETLYGPTNVGWKGLLKAIKQKGWKMGDQSIAIPSVLNGGARPYKCEVPGTSIGLSTMVGRLEGDDFTVVGRLPDGVKIRNNKDDTFQTSSGKFHILGTRPHPTKLRVRLLGDYAGLSRGSFATVEKSDARVTRIKSTAGTDHDVPTWMLDRAIESFPTQAAGATIDCENPPIVQAVKNGHAYFWDTAGESPSRCLRPARRAEGMAGWESFDPQMHPYPNEPLYNDLVKYDITEADFEVVAPPSPVAPPVVAPVVAPTAVVPPTLAAPVVLPGSVSPPTTPAAVLPPSTPPVVPAAAPGADGLIVVEGRLLFSKGTPVDLFPGRQVEVWVQFLNDVCTYIQKEGADKQHPSEMGFDTGKRAVLAVIKANLSLPENRNTVLIVEDPGDPYWCFVRSWVLPLAKTIVVC